MRKHIKSIICLIFALILSVCAINLISNGANKVVFAETEDEKITFVGTGTQDDPIIISSAQQLLLLSEYVNKNESSNGVYYSQMYYELGSNIDLNKHFQFHYDAYYKKISVYRNNTFKFVIDLYGKTYGSMVSTEPKTPEATSIPTFWTPIGDGVSTFFSGSFDGKGYTISGLFYDEYMALADENPDNDKQYDTFALFGGIKSVSTDKIATVKNLNIENSFFFSSNDVASVVGNAIGSVKVHNCSSNAIILSSANTKSVAGLVVLNEGELLNSSYKGVINGSKVGGIANTNRGTIDNCLIVADFIFDDDNESVDTNIGAVCYINSSKLKNCYYLYNSNLAYIFRNNNVSNTSSIGYFSSNNIVTPIDGFTLSYGTDLLTGLQSWVDEQEERFYVWAIKENEYIPYLQPILTDVEFLNTTVQFDSLPHTIQITNLKSGDVVKYSLDNQNFSTTLVSETFVKERPTIIYATVERNGYAVLKGNATVQITVAVISFPSLLGEYVYSGDLQTANLENVTDFAIEISNDSRIVAGTQNIVCKLKYPDSTKWQDGTTTDYLISWEIKKLAGYVYDIKKLDKTYDGEPVVITSQDYNVKGNGRIVYYYKLKNENDASYTMVAPKNAGTYIIKITMQETDNYAESSATKEFTISKCKLQKPQITKYNSYNGKLQFAEIETNSAYQILNDSATEVGTYYAYVVLKDTQNYEWADGTTNILYLSWKILGSKPLSNALAVAITVLVVLAVEIGVIYVYWCVINKKNIKELVAFIKFDKKHSTKIKNKSLQEKSEEKESQTKTQDSEQETTQIENETKITEEENKTKEDVLFDDNSSDNVQNDNDKAEEPVEKQEDVKLNSEDLEENKKVETEGTKSNVNDEQMQDLKDIPTENETKLTLSSEIAEETNQENPIENTIDESSSKSKSKTKDSKTAKPKKTAKSNKSKKATKENTEK